MRMFFARLGASVTAQHTAAGASTGVAEARRAAAAAQQADSWRAAAAAEAQQALAPNSQARRSVAAGDERARRAQVRTRAVRDALAEAEQALDARETELDTLGREAHSLRDAFADAEHACAPSGAGRHADGRKHRAHRPRWRAEQALTARLEDVEALASRLDARETRRTHPTVVVVSHVGGWRPRAGNEYRLHRMLHWYRRQGYRVIPVIAPLPGEELSRDALAATAAAFGNVIQVHRDGRIEHDLRDVPEVVRSGPDTAGGARDSPAMTA